MKCQWSELLNLLPIWLRDPVDKHGREYMEELRLRLDIPPQIITSKSTISLERCVTAEDLHFCLNAATKYSPWTSGSITQGFVTASGGHRIGISGECVFDGDKLRNISPISSVCIRVARELGGVSGNCYQISGSLLIIGRPGSGKTTFLRDLIQKISNNSHRSVTVLDQRRELFPFNAGHFSFERGCNTDVLSGCNKKYGFDMAIRTMNPDTIAVDEITSEEDCIYLSKAAWCGVRLLATAHAGSKQELYERTIYRTLLDNKIFQYLIVLNTDKTWHGEVLS